MNLLNEFKNKMGMYDTLIEFQELSLRYFIKNGQNNISTFIKEQSLNLGVAFNPSSYTEAQKLIYRNSISMVCNTFDSYLRNLTQEILLINDINVEENEEYRRDNQKEDGFDYIIRIINKIYKKTLLKTDKNNLYYKIITHYKNIRDEFTHPHIKNNEKENLTLDSKYNKQFKELYPDFIQILDITHTILDFDDFILLSKTCLAFGEIIFIESRTKNVDYYIKFLKQNSSLFIKYNNNLERKKNSMAIFLTTHYNLEYSFAITVAENYLLAS